MRSVAGVIERLPRAHAVLTVLGLMLISVSLGARFGWWAGGVAAGASLLLVAVLIELDADSKPHDDGYRP